MKKEKFLSLTILTHNSLNNLKKYFTWVDNCPSINEVVIVDDMSSDNLHLKYKTIFSKQKVIFIKKPLDSNFSSQRTFAISKCSNNWILWLDSDETPSPELIDFLNHFNFSQSNYSFKRVDTFLEKQLLHGENFNNNFIRLFDKTNGKFVGQVHEKWVSTKPTTNLNFKILHYPHPDLKTFFEKINQYSTIRAQELFNSKSSVDMFDVILYPIVKFIHNYIIKLGFLDSTPGIIMAIGMSFHSFLVRAKLWHLYSKSST